MASKLKDTQKLKQLAQLSLNMNLSKLSQITQEEDAPRTVLAELATAHKTQSKELTQAQNELPQSTLSGADLKWKTWAHHKQRTTLSHLANIAQRREEQLVKTRRAFGRVDALKAIEKKLEL